LYSTTRYRIPLKSTLDYHEAEELLTNLRRRIEFGEDGKPIRYKEKKKVFERTKTADSIVQLVIDPGCYLIQWKKS
jgi:hypothetical protein